MTSSSHAPPMEASASLTRDAVRSLGGFVGRLAENSSLPQLSESARLVQRLEAAEAPPAEPTVADREALRRRLVNAAAGGRMPDVARRDLRDTPWLLWNGTPPLGQIPTLLTAILDHATISLPTLRRLIDAYLRDFDPRAPGIGKAAECIRQALADGKSLRLNVWSVAHREVGLFDPSRGPARVATRLLTASSALDVLSGFGLSDPLRAGGKFMIAVEEAVRVAVPQTLRDRGEGGLGRILEILAPEGRPRFAAHKAATARALLAAWLDGGPEPATAVRDGVRILLLRWFGDPRLRQQSWAAIGDNETSLVRRWLARASLDLFFRLIDEHALDSQWRYRHAFWLAYLEKNVISDAWLALGRQVHAAAKANSELGGAFGRLDGNGMAADQSVLLLRVGPLVLAEFSHNGRLRAWPAEWANAPRLGGNYDRADITGKCLPFPPNPSRGRGGNAAGDGLVHAGSNTGYWQGSAAALIQRHAGTLLNPGEWQPV